MDQVNFFKGSLPQILLGLGPYNSFIYLTVDVILIIPVHI